MTENNGGNFERESILLKEILLDDGTPQDSAGNTRLTLLADKIKLLQHNDHFARYHYIEAIKNCAKILAEFSITEIRNLCDLINMTELPPYEFHKAFLDSFKGWKATPHNVEQRAEVFRLIGESGSDMEVNFIEKGVDEIKEAFPWYWIDVAMYLNRDAAIDSIKEWLKINKDFAPILQRLPHWWDLYKDKEAYVEFLSSLLADATSEDVNTVRLFLESFGVDANKIDKLIKPDILLDITDINFLSRSLKANCCYDLLLPLNKESGSCVHMGT